MIQWFKRRAEARRERALHNDRDFYCKFWWGDRSGSAVGVFLERCDICNPKPEPKQRWWKWRR